MQPNSEDIGVGVLSDDFTYLPLSRYEVFMAKFLIGEEKTPKVIKHLAKCLSKIILHYFF